MKRLVWLVPLLLLMISWRAQCGEGAHRSPVLFVSHDLPHFKSFQDEMLMELQMSGQYQWKVISLTFAKNALSARIEQVKPLALPDCQSVLWIDELSATHGMIQLLSLAPGRSSTRTIEVNLAQQTPQDMAIAVHELLRVDPDPQVSTPPAIKADVPDNHEITPSEYPRPNVLVLGGTTDFFSVDSPAVLPGLMLDGCRQGQRGFGACISLMGSWRNYWRVADVRIATGQIRPGIGLFWGKRFSKVALGPSLALRPTWQHIWLWLADKKRDSLSYFNFNAALSLWLRVYLTEAFLLQCRLGGLVWARTLFFTSETTRETRFTTTRFSPLACLGVGISF